MGDNLRRTALSVALSLLLISVAVTGCQRVEATDGAIRLLGGLAVSFVLGFVLSGGMWRLLRRLH